MGVLTKPDILSAIEKNDVQFTPPLDGFQLQPHAIDLRLGTTFYIPRSWQLTENGREALNIDPLDSPNSDAFELITLKPGQYFEILPQEFVIASTLEKIDLNAMNLMAVLYPRSSINRRGLSVSLSGIIDTGYSGNLMIPIQNSTTNQVVKIYPGERICQIVLQELTGTLTQTMAFQHGLEPAKYHAASARELSSKPDKSEEIRLVKSGKIDELKSTFAV